MLVTQENLGLQVDSCPSKLAFHLTDRDTQRPSTPNATSTLMKLYRGPPLRKSCKALIPVLLQEEHTSLATSVAVSGTIGLLHINVSNFVKEGFS